MSRPGRGIYVLPRSRLEEYRDQVLGAASRSMTDRVASHESAAALHGIDMLEPPPVAVHFTASRRGSGRRRHSVITHGAPLLSYEVASVDGIPVTSLARTAVDLARTRESFESALVVMDSALHRGASRHEIEGILARGCGWRGIALARNAYGSSDHRAESVAETLSRAGMLTFPDIPMPQLQYEFLDEFGRLIARVDFYWEELKLIGECDGRSKFETDLRPGESVADRHWASRRRDERLWELGNTTVHWGWAEATDPARLHRRLRLGVDEAMRRSA